MKYLYIICFLLFFGSQLLGQLLTPFTLYRDQWGVLNPASVSNNYALDEFTFSVSATDRHQWLGDGFNWDYSPNTQVVNMEVVREKDRIVFGGHFMHDRTGDLSSVGGYFRFAYLLPLDRWNKRYISIGLSAGLLQNRSRIDGADQTFFRAPEEGISPGSVIRPDVSVGMFYREEGRWYAGISIPQMLSLNTKFGEDQINYSLKQPRHYYLVAGGYIPSDLLGVGDGSSFMEISGWARYLPIRQSKANEFAHLFRLDANLRYQHNQIAWLGFGLGSDLAADLPTLHTEFGIIGGEQMNLNNGQLKVGLAMDFPFGSGIRRLGPSAEINVIYSWY